MTVFTLIYFRTRRLPALIVAHWSLDALAIVITLKLLVKTPTPLEKLAPNPASDDPSTPVRTAIPASLGLECFDDPPFTITRPGPVGDPSKPFTQT